MFTTKGILTFIFSAVLIRIIKNYFNGPTCQSKATLEGKVVIVTGANTGLGKETAKDLFQRGAILILTCRNITKGNQARDYILQENGSDPERLRVMELDLTSLSSIRAFVKDFKNDYTSLDILINNAGVMAPPYSLTEDGYEVTFATNHLGHFLLTHLLIDCLVSSSPSRIVILTSSIIDVGHIEFDDLMYEKRDYGSGVGAYAQSKLANVSFGQELERRLKGTGVSTYLVHPGVIVNDIVRYFPLQDTILGRAVLYYVTWLFTKEPMAGAQTTICCAVDEKLQEESGKYYWDCQERSLPPNEMLMDQIAKALWNKSIQLLQISNDQIHPSLK